MQVPVLPVGVGPVVVGSLYGGLSFGATLDLPVLALVTASIVLIQGGANIQKGIVESRDLGATPARPTSSFVFDAGAVRRLGLDEDTLERLALGLFGSGAGLGLVVVAIRRDPLLLLLGLLGLVAAYSYSGAPFKLSYRGIGEVSTFLAFGPLMFSGAFYAQHPSITWWWLAVGSTFGFLAAAISFARYFPAQEEDSRKGKRTPVVRLGPRRALPIFAALVAGAGVLPAALPFAGLPVDQVLHRLQTMDLFTLYSLGPFLLGPVMTLLGGTVATLQLNSGQPGRVERGVRTTVVLHCAISTLWIVSVFTVFGWR
jgi:1,4-dihydroxy-2-naphthoate octaprenyltransferase